VSNAEQLAFLFFFYLVEGIDAENRPRQGAEAALRPACSPAKLDTANPLNAPTPARPRSRKTASAGRSGRRACRARALVRFLRDEVFPSLPRWRRRGGQLHARRALVIDEPTVLTQVVTLVDGLRLDRADADTKGDLFEHVLRQIKQAGELGQFRTPRHIIRAIVEMMDPKIGETVYDPAAGTAGFLVAAYNHIRLANSSPGAIADRRVGRQDADSAAWATAVERTPAIAKQAPSTATTSTRR
jgi:type I restriction enzyme M protein